MTRSNRFAKSTDGRTPLKPILFAAAVLMGLGFSASAFAQTAEELRRDGEACEQVDGYLRALNPGAQEAVNTINAQRRAFYEMRAAEEGVEVAAVAAVYAMELQSQTNYRGC